MPHLHDSGFQLRRQPFVSGFACLLQGWWWNGRAEHNLQIVEPGKFLMAWPHVVEAFDRHRDNRSLGVDRQNGGAFAKYSRRAVIGALAFRIQNQDAFLPEAKS